MDSVLVDDANAYFASLGNLSSRILQDLEVVKEKCIENGEWEELTVEQQENLLNRFIMDQTLVKKYAEFTPADEPPVCFPVLKINSGEKIVIDFEHDDGWTWTDEHSAPFSWKTKSQQDLTLADLDEIANPKEEGAKKNRFGKRPKSPDKSLWDPAIVNGDKGKNDLEKMFEKFGIRISESDDQDGGEVAQPQLDNDFDTNGLFNKQFSLENDVFASYDNKMFEGSFERDGFSVTAEPVVMTTSVATPTSAASGLHAFAMAESTSSPRSKEKKSKHKDKKEKKSKHKLDKSSPAKPLPCDQPSPATPLPCDLSFAAKDKSRISEFEMPRPVATMALDVVDIDIEDGASARPTAWASGLGLVSPVFIPDMADTSADTLAPIHESCKFKIILPEPGESTTDDILSDEVMTENPLSLSTSHLLLSTSEQTDAEGELAIKKTGFGFLDDW